ncbi:pentatricopeptide repeat-containing protein At1g63400-like [Selaginella moellendorffii]|uniref:pentatricopeptide repeat-containing protein At1g63400-like n=1 Tax=Selaginella moellendorffii TaxID=88036 RepID=UPI000D1C5407|nr:pentatricopeptide repeat-containing protein At1g63400-like [Selaginella moellendorffii]|eukprot:XP_024534723.1 pentatricopeptide repeat-containing protein At1g63400-like [Selaginella moellendorffii]
MAQVLVTKKRRREEERMLRRRRALELLLLHPRGTVSCWQLAHNKMPPWAALVPPGAKMSRHQGRVVNQLFPVVNLRLAVKRCPDGALPVEEGFVVQQGTRAESYYITRARNQAKGVVRRLLEATEAASPVLTVAGKKVSIVNRQVDPAAVVRELDRAWKPLERPLKQKIVLRVMGAVRNCSAGLHFFQWALQQPGLEVDTVLYNGLVEMLVKRGYLDQALRLYEKMKRPEFARGGCAPDGETLALLVRPLCRSNFETALSLVNEALDGRMEVGDDLLHAVIVCLCKMQGRLPLSLRYFHRMKSPGDETYQLLVRTMSKEQYVYEAYDLIVSMEVGKGFPTDDVTYHLLIAEFCRRKELSHAHVLLHDFMDRGRIPSVLSFNAVLELLCNKGDRDAAEKSWNLFQCMKRMGVAPNTVTYSILLQALSNGNRVDQAMILLDEMLRSGCMPGSITGSALVSALARADRVTDALDLVLRMHREFHTRVEFQATSNTVYGFLRLKPMKTCVSALKKLQEVNFTPDLAMYDVVIEMLCERDMIKAAMLYFSDLNRRSVPDVKSYEPLVLAFCRIGKLPVAYKLFRHMIVRGCDPSLTIYKALITSFCRGDKLDDACKLLEFMFNKDVYPDEELYRTVLEGLERTGNGQAFDVLKNALKESADGSPGEVMFKAVFKLRGCVRPAKDSKVKKARSPGKKQPVAPAGGGARMENETEAAEVVDVVPPPDDTPVKVVRFPMRFSDSDPESSSGDESD